MKDIRTTFAVLAVFPLLTVGPSHASIIGGNVTGGSAFSEGGAFHKSALPLANPLGPWNSVGYDTFEDNNLYGFDEHRNFVLPTDLFVDVGGGSLPAGTTVDSHYVFLDPGRYASIVGTVDFDSDILAIITHTGHLLASDFLGNTSIYYMNHSASGLEPGDSVTIRGARQILFAATAQSPGNYFRVLTKSSAAVTTPEPAASVLLGFGLAAMVLLAKRTQNRRVE